MNAPRVTALTNTMAFRQPHEEKGYKGTRRESVRWLGRRGRPRQRSRERAPRRSRPSLVAFFNLTWEVGESDVATDREPVRTTADSARDLAVHEHRLAAVEREVLGPPADEKGAQASLQAAFPLGQERLAPSEVAALELGSVEGHQRLETGLERSVVSCEIGSQRAVSLLDPQTVQATVPACLHAVFAARLEEPIPDLYRPPAFDVQLPAELARETESLGERGCRTDLDRATGHRHGMRRRTGRRSCIQRAPFVRAGPRPRSLRVPRWRRGSRPRVGSREAPWRATLRGRHRPPRRRSRS